MAAAATRLDAMRHETTASASGEPSLPSRFINRLALAVLGCALIAGCSAQNRHTVASVETPAPVAAATSAVAIAAPVGGANGTDRPYKVAGRTYVPSKLSRKPRPVGVGLASWYGDGFQGRRTANGETFDMSGFTAAHPTLPLPCYARVTNVTNGKSIVVRVNDRGPFHKGRLIDVSRRTADTLGFRGTGVGNVKVDYIGPAPASGDTRHLVASYQEFGRPAAPEGMQVASLKPLSDADLAAETGGSTRGIGETLVASAESVVNMAKSVMPGAPAAPKVQDNVHETQVASATVPQPVYRTEPTIAPVGLTKPVPLPQRAPDSAEAVIAASHTKPQAAPVERVALAGQGTAITPLIPQTKSAPEGASKARPVRETTQVAAVEPKVAPAKPVAVAKAAPVKTAAPAVAVAEVAPKRVIHPTEPVLASAVPEPAKHVEPAKPALAEAAAPSSSVASRIASSFDAFGPDSAFASSGPVELRGSAAAYR